MEATASEDQNKKNRKRAMTSSQVFSLFVRNVNGVESGAEILSEDCFNLWVATRNKKLVHPEESFRRTLIAHIRGAYGRKPFSASVEKSLLDLLRETVKDGIVVNPWERCFPTNSLHIGKRGFNKAGYHETKNPSSDQVKQESYSPTNSTTDSVNVVTKQESVDDELSNTLQFQIPAPFHQSDPLDHFQSTFGNEECMLSVLSLQTSPQQAARVINISNNSEPGKFGYLQKIAQCLTGQFNFEELLVLIDELRSDGFELFSPSAYFVLKSEQPMEERSFSPEFRILSPENTAFSAERPHCQVLLNLKTWRFSDEDTQVLMVLGQSIKGLNMFQVVESPIEFLYQLPTMFSCFSKGRPFCVVAKLVRESGAGVFLIRYQMQSSNFALIGMQYQGPEIPSLSSSRRLM